MTGTSSLDPATAAPAPISMKIVEAVAQAEGISPLDFDRPLAHVVDTDALELLFGPDSSLSEVTFIYAGYRVTIDDDREVSVSPTED